METMIAIGSRGAVVVVVVVVDVVVVVVQYNILQSTLSSLPSQKIRLISPSRAKISLQKEITRPSKKDEDGDIGKARACRWGFHFPVVGVVVGVSCKNRALPSLEGSR